MSPSLISLYFSSVIPHSKPCATSFTLSLKEVSEKLLAAYRETGKDIPALVQELGLEQVQDTGLLNSVADEVIAANPKAVADYKAGKEAAIKALMGQIMKRTKGAANPQEATALLKEKLAKL